MIINHHEIPILKPCLALIFGIFVSQYIPVQIRVSSILVYLILIFFGWQIISKKKTSNHSRNIVLLFMITCFGVCSMQERNPDIKSHPYNIAAESFSIRIDNILKHAKHKKCFASILSSKQNDSTYIQSKGKILVYFGDAAKDSTIKVGSEFFIKGKLSKLKTVSNPYAFDYTSYLQNEGVYHQVFVKQNAYKYLRQNEKSELYRHVYAFQCQAKGIIKKYYKDEKNQALVNAMVLGNRDDLDQNQNMSFINTGSIHVLAVSGLHVGILCIFLMGILKLFDKIIPLNPIIQGGIIISCIWFFALITGTSSAVCRAALMFSLFYLARDILKRHTSSYNIIFGSAFILLLINPHQLFKVSFQFSYLAVISIVFFYPYVNLLVNSRFKIINYLWSSVALGISAQILVFPISIYYFNKFASSFLLTSLFVVQLAMIILVSCLIIMLFDFLSLSFLNDKIIAPISNWVLELMQKLIIQIESIPYSYIDNLWIDKTKVVLLYSMLICVMLFMKKLNIKILVPLIFLIASYTAYSLHVKHLLSIQHCAFVYDSRQSDFDVFIGNQNYSLCQDTEQGQSFIYGRNRLAHNIKKTDTIDQSILHNAFEYKNKIFRLGNQFLAFANESLFTEVGSLKNIDYVLVNAEHKELLNINPAQLTNTEIIMDGSLTPWDRKELIEYCNAVGLSYYDIKKQGAKMIEF